MHHIEGIWQKYNIEYANITCIVTDTEATMVKSACNFCERAEQESIMIDVKCFFSGRKDFTEQTNAWISSKVHPRSNY